MIEKKHIKRADLNLWKKAKLVNKPERRQHENTPKYKDKCSTALTLKDGLPSECKI